MEFSVYVKGRERPVQFRAETVDTKSGHFVFVAGEIVVATFLTGSVDGYVATPLKDGKRPKAAS